MMFTPIHVSVNGSTMVKDIRSLPRLKVRDATHTSLLQRRYYKELNTLFNRFKIQLQPTMTRLFNRNIQNQDDYATQPGFARDFHVRVDATARATIGIGSPGVVRKNITNSYERGKKSASNNPRIRANSIIIPYELNYIDQRVVDDLIVRNVGLVTKLTEDMKQELVRTLTDGIKEQHSIDEMIREINARIPEITRARAKTIARTEIANSYVNAQSKAYRDLGLKQWQWLAALGYACCDECIAMHGNVYSFGDTEPPLHPNCLCDIYPIVDKEFDKPEVPSSEPPMPEPSEPIGKQPSVEEKIKENLLDFEDKIRENNHQNLNGQGFETVRVIDEKGTTILTKVGEKNQVAFTQKEIDTYITPNHENLIMTHNHPAGSGFSMEDYEFASIHNIKSIRAVSYDETGAKVIYIFERTGDRWNRLEFIKPTLRSIEYNIRQESYKKIDSGELTPTQASLTHHDKLWSKLQGTYGNELKFTYRKVKA